MVLNPDSIISGRSGIMTKGISLFDIFDGFFINYTADEFIKMGKEPARAGKTPKTLKIDVEHTHALEEVQESQSYSGLLKENVVLIDIDNNQDGEFLLNLCERANVYTRVHKTTHGYHFFFKIPKNADRTRYANEVNCSNAIGIKTDYKFGFKKSMAVLKYEGVERECVYNSNTMENLPIWLYSVTKGEVPDFKNLGEGGRNNTLFAYILTLQHNGFKKSEIKTIIAFINNYVLAEPLTESEIKEITRDGSFKTDDELSDEEKQGKGKRLLKMANDYIAFSNAKMINEHLHVLNPEIPHVYTDNELVIQKNMESWKEDITPTEFSQICWKCKGRIPISPMPDKRYIMCQNGVYDWESDTLLPFDDELCFISPPINATYQTNAYHELTDKTFNKIAKNDPELRALLEEIIGACICRDNSLIRRLFILYGDGSNGKSVYINILQAFLGNKNYSTVKLQDIEDDRFRAIEMYGKLANFGDDISAKYLTDTSLWKNIGTGDAPIFGQNKGEKGFNFVPYCTPIFSCNEVPRVADVSKGWYRRVCYVPFDAEFKETDPDYDEHILEKLTTPEALNYIFKLGVEGLKRLIANKQPTTGERVKELSKTVKVENDSFTGFVTEFGASNIVGKFTSEIYTLYGMFCRDNGHKYPISKAKFTRRLVKEYQIMTRVVTGNQRVYTEVKE